ncbi:MAG: twin-arginine translocase subunit TatC [Pirellulaceae bacterium]|nr:twin-arginine translocase subunit TatC [Pirellulaceae bacterium]
MQAQDDLFGETQMSFGDHLEELRRVLFQGVVGLVISCLIGLSVANYVVAWIEAPLKVALEEYYLERAEKQLPEGLSLGERSQAMKVLAQRDMLPEKVWIESDHVLNQLESSRRFSGSGLGREDQGYFHSGSLKEGQEESLLTALLIEEELVRKLPISLTEGVVADEGEDLAESTRRRVVLILNHLAKEQNLLEAECLAAVLKNMPDLDELRAKVQESTERKESSRDKLYLNSVVLSENYSEFLKPMNAEMLELTIWKPLKIRLQTLSAQEAFMIWVKAGFVAGMVIGCPWIFWRIWTFVASGLYAHERKYIYLYVPISVGLFFLGIAVAYFFVFHYVLNFLFSFNSWMNIDPDPRISEWIGFMLMLPLGFGISFQLPLVMLFLERIQIFTVEMYLNKWRVALLVIFVISMLLTPADPQSMLLMAAPLTGLYFVGISMCKWMPKGENPFDNVYDPGEKG